MGLQKYMTLKRTKLLKQPNTTDSWSLSISPFRNCYRPHNPSYIATAKNQGDLILYHVLQDTPPTRHCRSFNLNCFAHCFFHE